MKSRSLWFEFLILSCASLLAWAGQASSVEAVDGGRGTAAPNPDCQSDGVYCNWVNVVVPNGSQIDRVTVFASVNGQSWTQCIEAPSGTYMNCGPGVRFLNNKPGIAPSTGGTTVTWRMLNATSHKQWGKVVVDYR